ncbi:MAG: hypothetical protein WDM85_15090 [Caulobacteraceae bacterium]
MKNALGGAAALVLTLAGPIWARGLPEGRHQRGAGIAGRGPAREHRRGRRQGLPRGPLRPLQDEQRREHLPAVRRQRRRGAGSRHARADEGRREGVERRTR